MSKAKYRVGIIGCGSNWGRVMRQRFSSWVTAWRVVAACDILKEKVNAFVEQFEIPSAYTDMQQMLSTEPFDIVGVTTHNREHVEPTIAASPSRGESDPLRKADGH